LSSTDHKATHNVIFSTPLSPCPSMAWVSLSAPYFYTCLVCVLPSMWEIKWNLVCERSSETWSVRDKVKLGLLRNSLQLLDLHLINTCSVVIREFHEVYFVKM